MQSIFSKYWVNITYLSFIRMEVKKRNERNFNLI